jgi:hypothetical protein
LGLSGGRIAELHDPVLFANRQGGSIKMVPYRPFKPSKPSVVIACPQRKSPSSHPGSAANIRITAAIAAANSTHCNHFGSSVGYRVIDNPFLRERVSDFLFTTAPD